MQPTRTSPDMAASSPRMWRRFAETGKNFFDGDVFYSFRHSPLTIVAFVITAVMFIAAVFAPWVAPYDTYDLGSLSLIDAYKPPAWSPGGDPNYLLGTDDQGRDVLSAMIFGLRISLLVGFSGVSFSLPSSVPSWAC